MRIFKFLAFSSAEAFARLSTGPTLIKEGKYHSGKAQGALILESFDSVSQ